MFLTGEKIKLVRFSEQFITAKYVGWLNDQEVNKFLYIGRIPVAKTDLCDRNDEKTVMFSIMSNIHINGDQYIQDENFSEYIGTLTLGFISWIDRKCEVGYMIGEKNYWGLGIASEAVKLATDYGFMRLNMNKIEAGVIDGNVGSIKVLEKNGFKKYGVNPQDCWYDGKFYDAHRFCKLQEWL